MDLWQYVWGKIKVELTSADICGFLSAAQKLQIDVRNMEKIDNFSIVFQIPGYMWHILRKLAEKRGEKLKVINRTGLIWSMKHLYSRPVLIVGCLGLLILSIWIPSRVFFVRVEGNIHIPSRKILERAGQCGIGFGASRRAVRSEKIKNALLDAMPELSWAGVNTYGCTAVISVREKDDSQSESFDYSVSSIVAVRDGVIHTVIVSRGNQLCKVGQSVKRGQVLISGYTDCGLSIQATNASGEVFAYTSREISAICPYLYGFRGEMTGNRKNYSIILGNKRINFSNNSGISGASCAKIYEENYIVLPGGFQLPLAVCIETFCFYEIEQTALDVTQNDFSSYCRQYLLDQMCAGSIFDSDERILQYDEFLQIRAKYSCLEMIGITRLEENIPDYGEND
ncbi:MAG: sporulation protein YqfD [Oscillospiraceae bacterium]|nr:sporulation protein YqfD [Oscillospiraceae bacterium]